ncbi:uncharacterized protein LOC134789969 [Cydia splendana]|uniref:uncharacterized protein LOC134789969 n=1 Tax=Cydia splendana TaxID=1100963 RepID=UPI00300C10C5
MSSKYPPYPPYEASPAPPSVAETIVAGHSLSVQHKSVFRPPVHAVPKPARPKTPKVTDVKISRRAMRAHARCLRRHGAVLTDRLERLAKPRRRNIIYLWREHAESLPPETIERFRNMLNADEPFKPDQAYEYFVTCRKAKKKNAAHCSLIKKDTHAVVTDKRFLWARNATVAFARGIQQRLSRPGRYTLADGMLRLSNVILDETCGYMKMRTPSRRCTNSKAKFMMEMSDKIAVWIDEILSESDDRMLMMDFDEDEDILFPGRWAAGGGGDDFADDFLNMMGESSLLRGPRPAYLQFEGDMLEAFNILTDSMQKKGDANLLSYGKFNQTYAEGADELKQTPDFTATEFNTTLAGQLHKDLAACAAPNTPDNIAPSMKEMVDICSNFLAQHAEFNKDKGPAFKILIKEIKKKSKDELYKKGKINRTNGQAAVILEKAKGLEADHDDPNLSQDIHSKLSNSVKTATPDELKTDMAETVDICSKFLSQNAVDEVERGPAFDILIKKLEAEGSQEFTPQFKPLETNFIAAYVLKSAPGLTSITPDPETAPIFKKALQAVADGVCPQNLKQDMREVVERCANYLSAFIRDREKALQIVINAMKKSPTKELAKRGSYTMDYGNGATETETAPTIVPYLPIKDIADEMKGKLNTDTESVTPANLKVAVKSAVGDVSKHLSQGTALRSKTAGERYPQNLLAAVMKSAGDKELYNQKGYTETYAGGGTELQYAGKLEADPKAKDLQSEIDAELHKGVPDKIAPTIAQSLGAEALEHLTKEMQKKGDAPLANLQGYEQTYKDGAIRIKNADSLHNDKVDKGAYENVHGKLKTLVENNPDPTVAKAMPRVLDEVSQYLAAPLPETEADKRKLLGDLMARKEDQILTQEGDYKMTFTQGGKEIQKAPFGVTTSQDENKKKEIQGQINAAIPNKELKDLLHREAMKHLQNGLKKEGDKSFLNVGKFDKTYEGAAEMLHRAPSFGGENPNGTIRDVVHNRLDSLDKRGASDLAMKHMDNAVNLASNYISDVATKESGMTAAEIATWKASGAGAGAGTAAGAGASTAADMGTVLLTKRHVAVLLRQQEGLTKRHVAVLLKQQKGTVLLTKRHVAVLLRQQEDADEAEQQAALGILHRQLQAKGGETFYKHSHSELSHKAASDWLKNPSEVHQSVKESGDTSRLANKFERKLDTLVSSSTPAQLQDTMTDVVIEASHSLAEFFVADSYKALVKDGLIYEMQKHGNNTLIVKNEMNETNFFAAQRLKKMQHSIPEAPDVEPSRTVAHLSRKLEDTIRCRTMPRKLIGTMKEHIQNTAYYLSGVVGRPDPSIEAYVALLKEMDTQGSALLVEGAISKTYKDSAAYLRLLTSYADQINLSNLRLESNISNKLTRIMNNVPERGYTKSDLDGVIRAQTKLLVSYIMLQEQRTALLKQVVDRLASAPEGLLLRHGTVRQSNGDGARMQVFNYFSFHKGQWRICPKAKLAGKNTDQLTVTGADPVVERKVQNKIVCLMEGLVPDNQKELMDGVIADATRYLAVQLLQPRVIQVCKCMKSVFVQCELWCDEIFRRMSRPCCTCSRQLVMDTLSDLAPHERLQSSTRGDRAYGPGVDITIRPCPAPTCPANDPTCPADAPTEGCQTSYMLYSTEYSRQRQYLDSPTKLARSSFRDTNVQPPSPISDLSLEVLNQYSSSPTPSSEEPTSESTPSSSFFLTQSNSEDISKSWSYHTTSAPSADKSGAFEATRSPPGFAWKQSNPGTLFSETGYTRTDRSNPDSNVSGIPVISTDQMGDWHAMMVSLTWNVQAWRKWIQETVDRALSYQYNSHLTDTSTESWNDFQRKITTEALQWRQYNLFSRQLILRLVLRYQDKKIVSPTRGTVKNKNYMDCQKQMLQVIDMFKKWTHFISVTVKETDSLRLPPPTTDSEQPDLRWNYFKSKVEEYAEDWKNFNTQIIKLNWENHFMGLIPEWISLWKSGGPVWVVSACGAVPSGAVKADEATWVARTTHRGRVLPAALRPFNHCCVLYAQGAVHHYTKYQVLCNADVEWIPWRSGGSVPTRSVVVAPRVLVGRVRYRGSFLLGAVPAPHYRCHIVILGRPFAVNTYELLVLVDTDT